MTYGNVVEAKFCYLDVAYHLFDKGNWRSRFVLLDIQYTYIVSSPPNVVGPLTTYSYA